MFRDSRTKEFMVCILLYCIKNFPLGRHSSSIPTHSIKGCGGGSECKAPLVLTVDTGRR